MDAELTVLSTKLIIPVPRKEFQSPDEDMNLKVLKKCIGTQGIKPQYAKTDIYPDYFKYFWTRRMSLIPIDNKELIEKTVEIFSKVGRAERIDRIIKKENLKHENIPFKKMTLESLEKIVTALGAADIKTKADQNLMDGIVFAFQEEGVDGTQKILNGFGCVVQLIEIRIKPYFLQIYGTVQCILNIRGARVRKLIAYLIVKISLLLKASVQENILGKLALVLNENS